MEMYIRKSESKKTMYIVYIDLYDDGALHSLDMVVWWCAVQTRKVNELAPASIISNSIWIFYFEMINNSQYCSKLSYVRTFVTYTLTYNIYDIYLIYKYIDTYTMYICSYIYARCRHKTDGCKVPSQSLSPV